MVIEQINGLLCKFSIPKSIKSKPMKSDEKNILLKFYVIRMICIFKIKNKHYFNLKILVVKILMLYSFFTFK